MTIQKSFFVKHIVLFFSLVRTAFCQAICFNFLSNQDSFFAIYKNIVRLLVWHIKFEKRKALKKKISEELMPIA